MFSTIVWATDGSEPADRALDCAVRLAEAEHADLHVVHVMERLMGRTAGQYAFVDEDDREAKIRAQVKQIEAEHEVRTTLRMAAGNSGHIAGRIAELADELGADLIVVGTRGHTALGGLMLGSVTQRLLHEATIPVLVVPPAGAPGDGSPPAQTTSAAS